MDLIESVIGYDALYDSMRKCAKGVIWKDSVASFYLRAGENLSKLQRDLESGKYKAKPPKHFMVTSPKPREIASVAFRDRVYQRSLNDNVVYPAMVRSFIHDNFACQKGKGTDAARAKLKEFLRRYYLKHGSTGYVCQFDIHGYYPNMDHELTEQMFRKKLDPKDDYPDFGAPMSAAVSKGELPCGILLCRSGVGMGITANRFHGVRAVVAHSTKVAKASRDHNCSNVLVIPADYLDLEAIKETRGPWKR